MTLDKTSLKISKELNIDLMIVSRIKGKSKEELTEELLRVALQPYLKELKRQRFS